MKADSVKLQEEKQLITSLHLEHAKSSKNAIVRQMQEKKAKENKAKVQLYFRAHHVYCCIGRSTKQSKAEAMSRVL